MPRGRKAAVPVRVIANAPVLDKPLNSLPLGKKVVILESVPGKLVQDIVWIIHGLAQRRRYHLISVG